MKGIDILGIAAGVFTTISTLPQLKKSIYRKKVNDVSPWMFISILTGVSLWTIYGIHKNDWPIIVTNGVSALLNLMMFLLWFRYKNK